MPVIDSISNRGAGGRDGTPDHSPQAGERWRARPRYRQLALLLLGLGVAMGGSSCRDRAVAQTRQVTIQQTWELELGDAVGGFQVVAGLGDISIDMRGAKVRAPFTGEVEPAATASGCVFFSSWHGLVY